MTGVSSDTAAIRSDEAFDEGAVAGYLRKHLPDLVGTGEIAFDQFPGGRANLTYRAVGGDFEVVLRRAPHGEVAKGGHDMAREFRVLSRLWTAFPLAPRAYHYCPDPEVMGKPFFVMERRHGHVVRDSWPEGWRADDDRIRRAAADQFIEALADLHRVQPDSVGLGDLGHPDGFVARQLDGWAGRWNTAKTRDLPEMEAAADLLKTNLPEPQAAVVLHNDFKLDNAMFGGDGGLVAIFDWDMATRGDPLVDVGTLLAYWVEPDGPTHPIFGEGALTLAPYLSRGDLIEQYAAATGFDVSGVRYYEGFALYRIAVVIEQIYARYVAGQTADTRFADFAGLPPILARAAFDVLSTP